MFAPLILQWAPYAANGRNGWDCQRYRRVLHSYLVQIAQKAYNNGTAGPSLSDSATRCRASVRAGRSLNHGSRGGPGEVGLTTPSINPRNAHTTWWRRT